MSKDEPSPALPYRSRELETTLAILASHAMRCLLDGCRYEEGGDRCRYCNARRVGKGLYRSPVEAPIGIVADARKRATHPIGSISEAFESFRREILEPIGAGDVQTVETRRAFYAGSAAIFGLVLKAAAELDADESENYLVFIGEELEAWGRLLDDGKV